jgi:gas vesicle protein
MTSQLENLMRLAFVAALLLAPVAAVAQQTPIQQQLDSMTATITTIATSMRSQIMADQGQIADLQKQLAEAKKPPVVPDVKKSEPSR